ncbi:MAG: thymidine phosphorylase [Erysipelotrichia bacterium]|nr:thymidine phosphorylase [Erysipelotrichia bacterium]NCC54894.1 thymidine phosphorylase [Erysipelotrichia bacterium]
MNIIEIIEKKRDCKVLSETEIQYFITHYVSGEIKDYQASALLMAICINGMNDEETFALTKAMLHSGEIVDLSKIEGIKVDKHSTGGVGDKTTLVLGPILAACGLSFAKMSGRGLSHTGGTLDKLESIEGFNVNLDSEQFIKQVNDIHIAIIAQSEKLVIADKKLYALRDVSGCVPSIPLIAASIMSKKLAANADMILLDVKYGEGAFMKTKKEALVLAELMIRIGHAFDKVVKAEITNMNEPLGNAIGNTLEVKEAVNTLLGKGPMDFNELCIHSACTLLMMAKKAKTKEDAYKQVKQVLDNRQAFAVFVSMVKAQGGNIDCLFDSTLWPQSRYVILLHANRSGYITHIHTRKIALFAAQLGANRLVKEDPIDHEVGLVLTKKRGDYVQKGEVLCEIHTQKQISDLQQTQLHACFVFDEHKPRKEALIYRIV